MKNTKVKRIILIAMPVLLCACYNMSEIEVLNKPVPNDRIYRYQEAKFYPKLHVKMLNNNRGCNISFYINNGNKVADFNSGEEAFFYLSSGVYDIRIMRSSECVGEKYMSRRVVMDGRKTVNITIH